MLRQVTIVILSGVLFVTPSFAQEPETEAPAKSADEAQTQSEGGGSVTDKASFLLGFNMIKSMKIQGAELNVDRIVEGMRLAESGAELPMSMEEARSVLQAFEKMVNEKRTAERNKMAVANQAKGEEFLKQNAAREGVQTLEDGVQYEVMKVGPGEGESPKPVDFVKVNYKGMYTDGKQFDASGEKGPAEFPVGGVIRGFSSVLTKMKVGDKWKVFIPSELAYGERGKPPIGPNEALVFELELVEIVKKDPTKNAARKIVPGKINAGKTNNGK